MLDMQVWCLCMHVKHLILMGRWCQMTHVVDMPLNPNKKLTGGTGHGPKFSASVWARAGPGGLVAGPGPGRARA